MKVNLKPASYARYWEMLGVLPPAIQLSDGFLVGEPYDHRKCITTGRRLACYSAFFGLHYDESGDHFEAEEPLTIPEFRQAIALRRAGRPLEITKETV